MYLINVKTISGNSYHYSLINQCSNSRINHSHKSTIKSNNSQFVNSYIAHKWISRIMFGHTLFGSKYSYISFNKMAWMSMESHSSMNGRDHSKMSKRHKSIIISIAPQYFHSVLETRRFSTIDVSIYFLRNTHHSFIIFKRW